MVDHVEPPFVLYSILTSPTDPAHDHLMVSTLPTVQSSPPLGTVTVTEGELVTVMVRVVSSVAPPVSLTSNLIVLVPAAPYWWLAVFVGDQPVSQVPSFSQSQRT